MIQLPVKKGTNHREREGDLTARAFHDKSTNYKPFLHPHISVFDVNWFMGLSTALNTPVKFSGISDSPFKS